MAPKKPALAPQKTPSGDEAPQPVVESNGPEMGAEAAPETPKTFTRSRGHGWIFEGPEEYAKLPSTNGLFGGMGANPYSASLLSHVREIRNQWRTSMCVTYALGCGVSVRGSIMGYGWKRYSASAWYTLARTYDRWSPEQPLLDIGSKPFQAALGGSEYGLVYEADYLSPDSEGYDPDTLNAELPWDVLQKAVDLSVTGLHAIDSSNQWEAFKQSISKGFPVGMGAYIGDQWHAYNPAQPLMPEFGNDLEGHMTCLVGYEGDIAIGVNSWGYGWGNGGVFRVHRSVLEDHRSILYVAEVGPLQLAKK